jgi:hypothetical protein
MNKILEDPGPCADTSEKKCISREENTRLVGTDSENLWNNKVCWRRLYSNVTHHGRKVGA